jgi:hypothetical protein
MMEEGRGRVFMSCGTSLSPAEVRTKPTFDLRHHPEARCVTLHSSAVRCAGVNQAVLSRIHSSCRVPTVLCCAERCSDFYRGSAIALSPGVRAALSVGLPCTVVL